MFPSYFTLSQIWFEPVDKMSWDSESVICQNNLGALTSDSVALIALPFINLAKLIAARSGILLLEKSSFLQIRFLV